MFVTIAIIVIVILIAAVLFEYRIKRPDQIVLHEVEGKILQRKSRFYSRHFSLAIPATIQSFTLTVEAEAKGKLKLLVKLSVTAAAALDNLFALIRVGGWNKDAILKACKELEGTVQGYVREFTEKYEIEELSSEKIYNFLLGKVTSTSEALGLKVISLSIHSIDPVDKDIAEAMRQQEAARILETTETANQNARMAAAQLKYKSDEQITILEHNLEIKKYDLKQAREEKEAILAQQRLDEELKRREKQLELDKKEMDLLKNSPELLMLSPQMARLAEASQSLKNARTVVSLSPDQVDQSTQFVGILQSFLQRLVQSTSKKAELKIEEQK
ncbi:MAG: hypothetical protein NTX22_09825 [Ignavibacteriales bacterium]|nr:hypothetical protein [Ignavibacteriales bacterium]